MKTVVQAFADKDLSEDVAPENARLAKILTDDYDFIQKQPTSLPPPPITSLTMEQQFKMRQIEDYIRKPEVQREDLITVFLALQRQCLS